VRVKVRRRVVVEDIAGVVGVGKLLEKGANTDYEEAGSTGCEEAGSTGFEEGHIESDWGMVDVGVEDMHLGVEEECHSRLGTLGREEARLGVGEEHRIAVVVDIVDAGEEELRNAVAAEADPHRNSLDSTYLDDVGILA
jgi:hypothetical protein